MIYVFIMQVAAAVTVSGLGAYLLLTGKLNPAINLKQWLKK